MATVSFKEDLNIADEKTAKKVLSALKQPRDKTVKSVQPAKLPKDASSVWFKRCEK